LELRLSLDDAIRISLENARVVRVLTGLGAVSSGQTIYDPAINNTTIDQEQSRFDPILTQNNRWARSENPTAISDSFDPFRSIIFGSEADLYRAEVGLTKTNLLGGQLGLNYNTNPT